MTTLLGIETATAVTAVALQVRSEVQSLVVDDARRHTEVLAPAIEQLLSAHAVALGDLDGIVVDVGPGLFTGLRVGVATAKGLSLATGVGLFAVTSTDALAAAACAAGVTGTVVAIVDARRQEVFCASYRCERGTFDEVEPVALATPGELAARLAARAEPCTLVGDGSVRHRAVLGGVGAIRDDLVVPSPGAALELTARRIAAGATAVSHQKIHPWYLREADAVANFAVREAGP